VLGQAYLNGQGVDVDETEGLHWLQRAEAQDHVGALTVLGYLSMKGQHGVAVDPARGVALYRRAAERDIPRAQHGLALAYLDGEGVEADPAEAARWMSKAAEAGLPASQRVMARLYREGIGVPQDMDESLRWLRLAANAGDAAAQYNLGLSLAEGIGVERDPAAAVEWYKRASNQGHALAQIKLGVAYLVGEGADPDPVRSYAYFELGRRGGAPIPADGVDRLNALLTEEQRAQAAVLVEQLSAGKGGDSAAGS
jgi:TPR repeat protein